MKRNKDKKIWTYGEIGKGKIWTDEEFEEEMTRINKRTIKIGIVSIIVSCCAIVTSVVFALFRAGYLVF